MTEFPFVRYFTNTMIICVFVVIGATASSSFVAYGFSRVQWPGREMLFVVVLGTLILPYQVVMIPQFLLFRSLGWVNTYLPLTVPAFFGNAFFIFLFRQYFLSLPLELDDAAKIDGAGVLRIWWSVLLPLIKPAIAAAGIFSFISHWNDFLGPLIFLNTEDKFTVALGVNMFFGEYQVHMDLVMAYSVMVTLPVILVFFVFQRYFVQGIALTGLTGR
jgi:multiple sugar transport system permease protein